MSHNQCLKLVPGLTPNCHFVDWQGFCPGHIACHRIFLLEKLMDLPKIGLNILQNFPLKLSSIFNLSFLPH